MVGWLFGFVGAWAIVVVVLVAYRTHRWLLRSVAPAAAVLVLGGLVLFVAEQGQDLGSALLEGGIGRRLWFAAALLYWALATWHSARFPLDRAHAQWLASPPAKPAGAGERRRSWTPRLLGGVVFAFALGHLALAVHRGGGLAMEDQLWDAGLLALLILAMAALYGLFVVYRRTAGRAVGRGLAARSPTLAGRLDGLFTPDPPAGADERLTTTTAPSTWIAFLFFLAVGVVLAAMAWTDPQRVGERFGSMALGFVAFGGFLAGLVALWIVSERIRWPLPVTVAALLVVSLVVSFTRHYHPVRDCAGLDGCLERTALEARPSVAAAAIEWYEQARQLVPDGAAVPMLVVATAGGGLRAAYWTAVVLGSLPGEAGIGLDLFERHTFAVSGVSGGSVGAAFRTALAPEHADAVALDAAVRTALAHDFLAPTLAALAFVDLPSWILPEVGQTTRGVALEQAFERAAGGRLAAPFMAARAADAHWRPLLFLNATHQETGRRVIAGHARIDRDPFLDSFDLHALLGIDVRLSTAAHNSARFSYVSPAGRLAEHGTDADRGWIIDGGYFENFGALTALDVARAALDAIAAQTGRPDSVLPVIVQISSDPGLAARAAGDGERRDRARLDELLACAAPVQPRPDGSLPPYALPYDATLDREARLAGNQILAPLRGIMGSREAHGITASKELARFACARRASGLPVEYAHFAMCETARPPLGWVLSGGARAAIEAYLGACDNPEQMDAVRAAFGR